MPGAGQGKAASMLTQAHELLRDRMEQRDDANNISSDLRFFYNTVRRDKRDNTTASHSMGSTYRRITAPSMDLA